MSKVGVSRKSFLGDLLVDRGLISPAQKDEALRISRETSRRLGEILIEMGPVSQEDISKILAEQAGLRFFRLRQGLVDPQIVNILPRDKATMYEVLPLFRIRDKLILAIGDPNKIFVLDTVKKLTGCTIEPVVCPRDDILPMIEKIYGESPNAIEDLVPDFDESDLEYVSLETTAEIEDIAQIAGESPVINLVNQIILKSLKNRASDIHIEPEPKYFRVRFRIDGVLYEIMRQRIELHAPVVSRLKLMANLDIAERRHPQDGRVQVVALGREVDLRLSTLPGVCGEKAVLRILDKQKGVIDLDQLGFDADTMSAFRSILARPNGLLLVTGPTGSGKTTTLYAGLKTLNSIEKNIVTIEDPVEYQFEIINQNQVKKEIGYTFASILKSTLRQDPDIIMVGEIRDPETAKIAVQAALTGHLVLSTVHTNDAASSISRLLDIGVEPYLLAPSLIGVIGQRLVRTNCPECAEASFPSPAEKKALGIKGKSNLRLYRGRGCENCFDSGYHGRVGIFELLVSDEAFQNLLLQQPTLEEIRKFQVSHGLATLRSEGVKLVREGKSTLEEVSRAVSLG